MIMRSAAWDGQLLDWLDDKGEEDGCLRLCEIKLRHDCEVSCMG